MAKVRRVYIDCGAWEGDSVLAFKKYYKRSKLYSIYAFECHPKLRRKLTILSKRHNFEFINMAVWIRNGRIRLYPGKRSLTQSSSVILSKKRLIDKDNPVFVRAIDFSEWIRNNFEKNNHIVCKMNIEGAEYPVLEKMIKDNSIRYIDRLYIDWHYRKLDGFPEKKHNRIRKQVKKRTEVLKWDFIGEEKSPF